MENETAKKKHSIAGEGKAPAMECRKKQKQTTCSKPGHFS
jgi:hypothetical protein